MVKYFIYILIAHISITSNLLGLDDFYDDLEFIYKTIIEDHPGLHNALDPSFQKRLENNYNSATRELSFAKNDEDKIEVLRNFGRSFQDSHLWVKYESQATQPQMPGIAPRSYEIEDLTKNVCWVHIPSFYPSSDSQKRELQQIIEKLPKLRDKTIIFDVRGNRGGSYTYGTQLIESLFSKIYADKCLFELYRNSFVIWRVSSGNIKHMNEIILPFLRQTHADNHSLILWNESLSRNLEEALLQKIPFYRQPLNFKGDFSLPWTENLITKPIFVVVDRNCYSATLMFIDELKGMNANITLIGEVTGADSMYMELRVVPLPSGKGKFGFPIYVYSGPSRENNIPYYPDIQYSGDLQNTIEVQDFILKLIE